MQSLNQDSYEAKFNRPTFRERQRETGNSFTDYGRLVGAAYSAQSSYEAGIMKTFANWVKTKSLADDSPNVTEDEFGKSYAPILGLEFKEENQAQLDFRIQQGARRARQNEMIQGQDRMITNFVSSFAGGMADPVNLVPLTLPAKLAKSTIAMNASAGRRAATAFHQGKLTFKNVLAVNASLELPYALVMNDTGVEEYTLDHLKMSAGMNLLLGGVMGGGHGYLASRQALKIKNARRQLNQHNLLMEADDFRSPMEMAMDDNPNLKEMLYGNPRIKDFLSGKDPEGANLNVDDISLMYMSLDTHVNGLKLKALQQDIAQEILNSKDYSGKSMIKGRKDYTDRMSRIVEAVLSGKVTKKLTDDDIALLKKYDIELDETGTVVNHSKLKKVPSNHPAEEYALSNSLLKETSNLNNLELELSALIFDENGNRRPLTLQDAQLIKKKELELNNALDAYYETHGKYFDQVETQAIEMVNKTFNLNIKGKKFEKSRRVLTALEDIRQGIYVRGAVKKGSATIRVELPHRVLDNSRLSPFEFGDPLTQKNVNDAYFADMYSMMMHESIHVIQDFAPELLTQLTDYADSPLIAKALNEFLTSNKYKPDTFKTERPAVLLEWAMGQEGYWQALHDGNKSLYRQLIDFISNVAGNIARYLGKSDIVFNKKLKPKDVAYEVGKIMSDLRKEASLSGKLKKAYEDNPSPADVSRIDVYDSLDTRDSSLSKTYENDNFNSRANENDKYQADPKKYLEDTIARLTQDDTFVPTILNIAKISDPVKRTEAITKLVESESLNIPLTAQNVKDMIINLDASMKRSRLIYKIAKLNDPNQILAALAMMKDKGLPLDPAQRIGTILLQEKKTTVEKLSEVRKYLVEEDHAMILRAVHDASVRGKLIEAIAGKKTAKAKLAQLKTLLDGNRRAGVDLGPSVQRLVEEQIRRDQLPLLDYLTQHDLEVIFLGEDVSHYMSSYKKASFDNPALIRAYGNDVKAASKQMHIDIMTAMTTGKMPKRWEGIPVWEGLVDVIRKINKGQMAEINYLGVNMRERKGFSGYTMRYDRQVVASMTEKEFISKMMNMMDLGKTFMLHGGIMEPPVSAVDKAKNVKKKAYVKFDHRAMLSTMYNEIVNGKFELDPDVANPSAVGAFRKSMKIAFKPRFEIEARIEFGNYQSLGRLMLEQIRGRSERISLVKHLGHDVGGNIKKIARDNNLNDGSLSYKVFDATVDQVSGVLDNPADVQLSSIFKKARSVSNLAYLAGSGLSTLSDIPLSLATLSFLGIDGRGFAGFVKSYKEAVSRQFKGDQKAMSAWYKAQGAGFDMVMRTYAGRVVTDEGKGMGWLDFGSNALFEINGLNRFTGAHQQFFLDYLSSDIAKQLRTGKMNDTTMLRMTEFGFTPDEVMSLAKYVQKTPDGVYRLGPSNIGDNTKLQRKLSTFYGHYMKEAVIEPDAGAQAISRLGLQAGTFAGESARIAFQYSSFMLGMSRVVYRRFMNGYTGNKKQQAMRNAHLIAYLGTALAFAYMTTVLKDLSRFKEPISPLDMSENDMLRLLSQSGVLGVLELPLNAQRFGADAAFAPLVGAGKDVLSGDIKQAVDPLLGTNYPIIGPLMKKVSFVASETLNNIAGDELTRFEEQAQEFDRRTTAE
jgi:hypothetical protein